MHVDSPLDRLKNKEAEPDSDSAGRWGRHSTFALRLAVENVWIGVIYSHFMGTPVMDKAETRIEIPFQGRCWRGEVFEEGDWTAIIKGQRLSQIYERICEGVRLSIKPTGPVEDQKKPEVASIRIEAFA